jgi:hypothetical protein
MRESLIEKRQQINLLMVVPTARNLRMEMHADRSERIVDW